MKCSVPASDSRFPGSIGGRSGVVSAQPLESKAAVRTRRNAERDRRRFQQKRAAAAHRIEQRRMRFPAGNVQDAGGKILAQRRIHGAGSPAPLEQRIARGVEVETCAVAVQEHVDAHVGVALDERANGDRREVVGAHAGERAAVPTKRGAHRIADECLAHVDSPGPSPGSSRPATRWLRPRNSATGSPRWFATTLS